MLDLRSFLVVIAASRRSRQRPSPLRGGHGVMAEVFVPSWLSRRRSFLHRHKNNAKKIASHATSAFLSQEPAWRLRRFAALAPPGGNFGEIVEKKGGGKLKKSHLHWPWAVVMWRSSPRRLGGHGGLLRTRPVAAGGFSWRSFFLVFQFGG